MSFISSLGLTHFRCYTRSIVGPLSEGFTVFYGVNGAGKTNILEAASLLSPGRGLRRARGTEILQRGAQAPWAVSAVLQTSYGPVRVGTGLDSRSDKRAVRINGADVRGQSALGEHLSCVWLTPQMDRLFLDSSSQRRRFLDRLVFAFDPGHSGRVSRYENAMRQRSRLLQGGKADPAWLGGLEAQMAEAGVAIAAARLEFAGRLQAVCGRHDISAFPKVRLAAHGTLEELLAEAPALEVEELFKYQLRQSRGVDMLTGGAATGPHKADLHVFMADKDMAAAYCSTGEQKALLLAVILAHAHLIKAERGAPPLLLLDEVAAHLDEDRRVALYGLLGDLGGQVWLTGTDRGLFAALEGKAQFFEVYEAKIKPV